MRSIRTNRGALVGLLAFALVGCGRQFGFQSGTYRGQADPGSIDEALLNGTVLVIDEPARTATLRVPSRADVALRLMDLPASGRLATLCGSALDRGVRAGFKPSQQSGAGGRWWPARQWRRRLLDGRGLSALSPPVTRPPRR
jgi:hypothetical protein